MHTGVALLNQRYLGGTPASRDVLIVLPKVLVVVNAAQAGTKLLSRASAPSSIPSVEGSDLPARHKCNSSIR